MNSNSQKKNSAAGRQSKFRPRVIAMDTPKKNRAEVAKTSTQTLNDSEVRYRRLFEAAQDGILILDAQTGMIDDVNPYLIDMLGYSREEFVKKKLWEVGAFKDIDASKVGFKVLQEKGYIRYEDLPLRAKGGQLIQVEFVSNVYPAGDKIVIQCNIRDITNHRLAEDALLMSEKHYLGLFENMLNGFAYCKIILDNGQPRDFIYLDVNTAFGALTGLKHVVGKKASDVIPGIRESDPELIALYGRVALTGKSERLETYVEALKMWFSISVYSPQKGYFVAVFDVITERKRAEDELRKAHEELEIQVQQRTAALSQSNMLLQTLLDNMPDQIYFKDLQSRFIKNSRSQTNALGLSDPSEAIGKTDFDFFPHASRAYADEQEIIRSGKPLVDFDERAVWPDGHETWVSTTKVPLRDHEGKIIGTFGISRDTTDRRNNEDALRKARDELEAFSYSVSHDLRAPLRGIDGWSLALLEDYGNLLDKRGQEYIQRVRSETQHMGELIDDLLQLSRITRAEIHTERIDLSAIARSIVARLQESEPQRQVEFVIQNDLIAKGDAHLMEVALTNLLGNAFKFTGKSPHPRVDFGLMNMENRRVFFVRDNGAGFDMAYAKKLFGAFQRMHKASEFPGTGIGLATVQRIINHHGGRVWAESAVNLGATFFFTLQESP